MGEIQIGYGLGVSRLDYPATNRNREPILAQLRERMPAKGEVVEIASGSGQHAAYFAEALDHLHWQPTDIDDSVFASIRAWTEALPNVRDPLRLDTTEEPWPVAAADAIYCANMVHIAPWEACLGLLAGAGRILRAQGSLILYGPFMRHGQHTAPSNEAFAQRLAARDPSWGVRDLEVVAEIAQGAGLTLEGVVEMPANNLTVHFRRR